MIWLLIETLALFPISSLPSILSRSGMVSSFHFFLLSWCPFTWKAMTFFGRHNFNCRTALRSVVLCCSSKELRLLERVLILWTTSMLSQ